MLQSNLEFAYVSSLDLYDQLMNNPETRFHAAYLFLRYFLLVVGPGELDEAGWNSMEDNCTLGVEYVKEEKDLDIAFPNYGQPRNKEVSAELDRSLLKE